MQSVDKTIVTKIEEMVEEGICSIPEIRRGLKTFVTLELFKGATPPKETNRRFFPTKNDIRNHFNIAYAKRKFAKIDQANLNLLVDSWKSTGHPDDNIFFRQYVINSNLYYNFAKSTDNEIPVIECQQTMLFVHQLAWQRRLLLRYGQNICLLDATYKTTKYALPLFFLCVKTNVGYQVVATFITQNETTKDIQEALQILKEWCPTWNPTHFMTDKCEAEINAVESVFNG